MTSILRSAAIGLTVSFLAACSAEPDEAPKAPHRADITLGNGKQNEILTAGLTREGDTFTFSQVTMANNGWLVLHEFKDGKPDGKDYVGATYLTAGTTELPSVTVRREVSSGEPFLVMLHQDVDEDQVFDFVFVDDTNVEDRAVFEGNTMIAHIIQAP